MKYFYINSAGQTCGPIDETAFEAYGITADTPLWCEGMSDWARARHISALASRFAPHRLAEEASLAPMKGEAALNAVSGDGTAHSTVANTPTVETETSSAVAQTPTLEEDIPLVAANMPTQEEDIHLTEAHTTGVDTKNPSAVAMTPTEKENHPFAAANTPTTGADIPTSAAAAQPAPMGVQPSATDAAFTAAPTHATEAVTPIIYNEPLVAPPAAAAATYAPSAPPPLPEVRTAADATRRVDLLESLDLWKWWNIAIIFFAVLGMCFSLTWIALPCGILGAVRAHDVLRQGELRPTEELEKALRYVRRYFYAGLVLFAAGIVGQIILNAALGFLL